MPSRERTTGGPDLDEAGVGFDGLGFFPELLELGIDGRLLEEADWRSESKVELPAAGLDGWDLTKVDDVRSNS